MTVQLESQYPIPDIPSRSLLRKWDPGPGTRDQAGTEKSDQGCPGAFTSLRGGCGVPPPSLLVKGDELDRGQQ